ncbi:MAG TPA: hypothetical protein VFT59_04440 [Candidatus Saccharimonadales bacterium]|nr:hypothetical protein [Candidatus Saccharimonadales bacterium]
MTVDLTGLASSARVAPTTLGRRGSRLVYDLSHAIPTAIDPRSGLPFCPVQGVFGNPNAVFLGFGTPNVFTMIPKRDEGDGWNKFTAFMFWRQQSYVASITDRMQVGVYYELRGLPTEAVDAIRREMYAQQGRRTISCANANARVLHAAGFRLGNGRSLKDVVRPSRLAALIWEYSLTFKGEPVEIRVIEAGREVGDHFVAVWLKELTSLCRTVKKKFMRHNTTVHVAPTFDVQRSESISLHRWTNADGYTTVSISRPSSFGVWLGFVLGQRPIFEAKLGKPLDAPELLAPLSPFPGKLSKVTKLKKYVLFSRPAIRWMRGHIAKSFDAYPSIPRRAVAEMLRRSEGKAREDAFIYNVVVTGTSVRITRLENRNGRDRKFINWVLSKHLMVSGYDPDTRFAGELWCYEENGELTIFLTRDSGSYKPGSERLEPLARYLSEFFGVPVRAVL